MFGIIYNSELLKYLINNYSMQKISEEFKLSKVLDFQEFFIKLFIKGLLPEDTENLILKGDYELTTKKDGLNSLICHWYDNIEWNDIGIYFVPEHGKKRNIISNAELIAVKDYIKNDLIKD